MANLVDYLANARGHIVEVGVAELMASPPAMVIDVREADEREAGALPGALHIARGRLELAIEVAVPDRDADLVVYCAGGTRSALAARTLGELGYRRVRSLAGGFAAWKAAGGAIERPTLDGAQVARYARHLRLAEVGPAGQQKLLNAKVLLVGAGGLGSPAALYLAAAGVGTLGVVDDDVVDASNLQRQVIHSTHTLGMSKVESAARAIEALNPDVKVARHATRMDADNVLALLADHDLVVDGTDNFATRYLLNDAALLARKPVVHASVYKFEGQVTVFMPFAGPCYRCLYPEPPPPGTALSCEQAGVLGVLPGVLGVLQATEAVKLILGIGAPLVGRLLQYDALALRFREFKLPRDPNCVVCAEPGRPITLAASAMSCPPP